MNDLFVAKIDNEAKAHYTNYNSYEYCMPPCTTLEIAIREAKEEIKDYVDDDISELFLKEEEVDKDGNFASAEYIFRDKFEISYFIYRSEVISE